MDKLKRWLLAIVVLCVSVSISHSQDTKAQLNTFNNSVIVTNGIGAITAATLNPLLGALINASCTIADPNNCPITALSAAAANLPLIGAASGGGVIQGTRSGTTTGFMTFSGNFVNGDCISNNNGNAVDAGGPCTVGGGGGTVSAGTQNQVAVYTAAGTGTTVGGTFSPNFPSSGFWQATNGSYIQRFNDQMLIGGATSYNGNFNNTGDWLSAYLLGQTPSVFPPGQSANLYVTNQVGQASNTNAISAGAQSVAFTSLGDFEGISSIVLNNNTTLSTPVWAFYGEAHCLTAVEVSCVGEELDALTTNNPGSSPVNPTSLLNVVDYIAGCGANITSPTNFPCDAAYVVGTANHQPFRSGLIFASGSLQLATGNIFNAIVLPPSYMINWYNGSALEAGIYADSSGTLNINPAIAIAINGQFGANCSGTPSSSFSAFHGIVTHC